MKVIDRLQNAVRGAAAHNSEVQVKPACILWPDPDRQWEAVVPQLQDALPEMAVLGAYAPDRRTGPAIWLRCAIAALRANKSETFDCLKFTLEGSGE